MPDNMKPHRFEVPIGMERAPALARRRAVGITVKGLRG
jgi:hypothetical protein